MFTELDGVLQHLGQSAARSGPHVADTNDTSAEESSKSSPLLCADKAHVQDEKSVGADEVGLFFATGATDAANKPSRFYCRICRKDVSVLMHGPYEVLRHFQSAKHFARDQ